MPAENDNAQLQGYLTAKWLVLNMLSPTNRPDYA